MFFVVISAGTQAQEIMGIDVNTTGANITKCLGEQGLQVSGRENDAELDVTSIKCKIRYENFSNVDATICVDNKNDSIIKISLDFPSSNHNYKETYRQLEKALTIKFPNAKSEEFDIPSNYNKDKHTKARIFHLGEIDNNYMSLVYDDMKESTLIVIFTKYTWKAPSIYDTSKNNDDSLSEWRVIESNLLKDKLWANLKKWIAKEFVSYKYTVDMEDRDNGTIILKFNSFDECGAGAFVDLSINATLQVDVKDKKYRYLISDAYFKLKPNQICDNMKFLSTSFLEQAKINLEAAQNLGGRNEIPDGLDYYESYYNDKLQNTPKFKKPSDEKRNKVNYEYNLANKTIEVIKRIRSSMSILTYKIGNSLEKGMMDDSNNW